MLKIIALALFIITGLAVSNSGLSQLVLHAPGTAGILIGLLLTVGANKLQGHGFFA